jgi:hypothetical protein
MHDGGNIEMCANVCRQSPKVSLEEITIQNSEFGSMILTFIADELGRY